MYIYIYMLYTHISYIYIYTGSKRRVKERHKYYTGVCQLHGVVNNRGHNLHFVISLEPNQ